jgi:hypothetical protein
MGRDVVVSGEDIWRGFERWIRDRSLAPMTEEEASQHASDAVRAYVRPGADPRAEWSRRDGPWKSGLFTHPDDTGIEQRPPRDVRKFTREQRDTLRRLGRNYRRWSVFEQPSDFGGITWAVEQWCVRTRATYVPLDVMRWRDPKHRAELKRRAREYAALQPEAQRC